MKRVMSFLSGLITGGMVGAAIAILYAPSSGNELRSDIERRMNDARQEIQKASAVRRAELEQQLAVLRAPRPSGSE